MWKKNNNNKQTNKQMSCLLTNGDQSEFNTVCIVDASKKHTKRTGVIFKVSRPCKLLSEVEMPCEEVDQNHARAHWLAKLVI